MNRLISLSGLAAVALLTAHSAYSAPRIAPAHSTCDRTIRYETLDDAVKSRLNRGETVAVPDSRTDTQYIIGYIYKLVDFDAELMQAVFSSYSEQKDHLKRLKESTVEEESGNWARVRYEADTGHWYVPNSHYTVKDVVSKDGATYMMDWTLLHSEGLTKLTYVDGYMRTQPVGSRALVVYCNYVIPDIKMSPGQVNKEGLEALVGTVEQLTTWVGEVNSDREKANGVIERYRKRLGL